uniref:Unannotated protein n=1 Tax=freshwater metagenome TaxID=449393 RepID=A0A6J6A1B4_9ZZZZ
MQRSQQPQNGATEEAIIRSEFPDVLGNQNATLYAVGEYNRLVAKGEPRTLATSRKAMGMAAEEFGLRRPTMPAVSAAQQQRYGAVPAQAGVRTGSEVRLDSSQKKMALARWPGDDEHVAYAKMAGVLRSIKEEPEQ